MADEPEKVLSPDEQVAWFRHTMELRKAMQERTANRNFWMDQLFPEGIGLLGKDRVAAKVLQHFPSLTRDEILHMNPAELGPYLELVPKRTRPETADENLDVAPATAKRPKRMLLKEANEKAKKLATADPSFATNPSAREWADTIGCSVGLVSQLPLWRETMKETGKGRGKGPQPSVKTLTPDVEALERLIDEQKADAEPSPLDPAPGRKVHHRKKL